MTSFLNGVDNALSSAAAITGSGGQNYGPSSFQTNGFVVPPIPGGVDDGLPSSSIQPLQLANPVRNIIHWFVPEVGMITMYVNPQSIAYNNSKLITKERTKGGFIVQYWGEELTTLNISGHTGGSGVEGLNVLYEIYRAEQILFDPIALTMASDNSVSGLNSLVDSTLGNIGGIGGTLANATNGILGLNPLSQSILPTNIPSLASMALGIELYYTGWVFRGYFNSFTFTESAERLGLFEYQIQFTVTQRRGYRTNSLAWQRSANSGPSNNSPGGVPLSFSGLASAFPSSITGISGQ